MKGVTVANHKLLTILMFSESKVTDSVFILCFIIQTYVSLVLPPQGISKLYKVRLVETNALWYLQILLLF